MRKVQGDNKAGNFKDGQWNVVHLRFLVDFMEAAALSSSDIAARMGLVRQSVYHWLVSDDMKMSLVYKLFEACGYSIRFALDPEEPAEQSLKAVPVTVDMKVLPPEKQKRLAFMDLALKKHNVDRTLLAEKLGLGKSTVYHWFQADDCFISYVYKVAELTGLRLTIRIRPL